MAGFKDIIGHEQIIEHLQNAITMDKVSHAYIINGPDKSGKMMLAEAFAAALQCERGGNEPCMECHPASRRQEETSRIFFMYGMKNQTRYL